MATMRVLQRYLDDALDAASTRRVAKHLEACRRCGLEAEVYEQIKGALGQQGCQVDHRAIARLRQFGEQLAYEGLSTHLEPTATCETRVGSSAIWRRRQHRSATCDMLLAMLARWLAR